MRGKSDLSQRSTSVGFRDFRKWATGHILASAVAFLGSAVGIPVAMNISGDSFWNEATQVIAYSLIGPSALLLFGFLFFWVRAVGKVYAERTEELKAFRRKSGMPTDDLEPKRTTKSWWRGDVVIPYTILITSSLMLVLSLTFAIYARHITSNTEAVLRTVAVKCDSNKKRLSAAERENRRLDAQQKRVMHKAEYAEQLCSKNSVVVPSLQRPQGTGRKTPP